jgi:hypothetical protein
MSLEIITLISTVSLALLGYLLTYWNDLRISKRKEQLELINKRISEFYGPLYVATQTGLMAYLALLKKLNRSAVFDDPKVKASEKDILEWRIWLKNVFMPNNEFIEKLILEKAYLIQEQEMPKCLLDFITHVSGYKAVIGKWENGDFAENLSLNDFPPDVVKYATESYQELKRKQLELIGKVKLDVKVNKKYSL